MNKMKMNFSKKIQKRETSEYDDDDVGKKSLSIKINTHLIMP